MAGPGYLSDAAAMTQAINAFDQCAADAKQAMVNLENELTSTLAQYKGNQATAFWQLHTEIQQQMNTANTEIDTMSNLVNQSFRNYNTGDTNAADSMRTVANSASSTSSVLSRLSGI
jgi:uncharacterized protein YukE